jgi:hypothetical protein
VSAVLEAADPNAPARRAADGAAAGEDVFADRETLERDATQVLLRRLQQLKGELQGVMAAAASSEFRKFTASSLIAQIDRLIGEARGDIIRQARSAFTHASDLGDATVTEPLRGARIAIGAAPALDRSLVTHAFDNTVDLLSSDMQQFRNQIVRGVRRAALAGESSFDQIHKLAGSIDAAGFDGAAFKAERAIRTELGRVLNGSTYDRLVSLADTLPFLRKGWRATRDGRTRRGHIEAAKTYTRGHGIPVTEPFKVNAYSEFPGHLAKKIGVATLRFPIDPDATPAGRIAAASTIMCRCNAFVDFDLAELQAFSTGRSKAVSPGMPGFAEPPIDKSAAPTSPPPSTAPAPAQPELPQQLQRQTPKPAIIPGGFVDPYAPAVQRGLEQAYAELLDASRFSLDDERRWREVLQVVNADGTRGPIHIGADHYVSLTPAMIDEIKAGTAWIHTHPSGSAFSWDDMDVAIRLHNEAPTSSLRMVVYGNFGTWHELQIPAGGVITQRQRELLYADYSQYLFKATLNAKRRTEAEFPRMAKDRGISLLEADAIAEMYAQAPRDEEVASLILLHFQEESVEAWKHFAAVANVQYRFYLPKAGTINSKNRSSESTMVDDALEAQRRGIRLDDSDMSIEAWAYRGPDTPLRITTILQQRLHRLGIDVDAQTGERRASKHPTAGQES